MKFRLLKAEEIDVRIGTVGKKTTTLLLYKDARCDMDLLDESVGSERWQRRHYLVGENLHCEVSIWFENIGWVSKSDVGTESKSASEKGEASDSFKRACVNWGLGRELYTAKDLRVFNDKIEWYDGNKTYDTFHVLEIGYDDNRNITTLAIANQEGTIVFSKGSKRQTDAQKKQEAQAKKAADAGIVEDLLTEYRTKVRQLTGNAAEDIAAYFMKAHRLNIYDATPGALRQAIIKIDEKIAKASALIEEYKEATLQDQNMTGDRT